MSCESLVPQINTSQNLLSAAVLGIKCYDLDITVYVHACACIHA